MTTKELAEQLSLNAAAEMPGYMISGCPIDVFQGAAAAEKISEACCLEELLDVMEAAHNVNENLNEFGALTDQEISNRLHDTLTALRAKLPKEIL